MQSQVSGAPRLSKASLYYTPQDDVDSAPPHNGREMQVFPSPLRARTTAQGAPSSCQMPADTSPTKAHMADALRSLFGTGKYSDLVIKCGGHRWNVHRAVVCMQSRPIAAALDGNFIEASTGEFILEEDDPKIVQLMLNFMYTGFLDIELQMAPVIATPQARPVSQNVTSAQPSLHPSFQSYQTFPYTAYPLSASPWYSGFIPTSSIPLSTYQDNDPQSLYPGSYAPRSCSTMLPPRNPTMSPIITSGTNTTYNPPANKTTTAPTPPSSSENSNKHLSKGLIASAQVYILADKYDVSDLKAMACKIYKHICKSFWDTEDFVESLTIIFDGTPDTTTEIDMLRATASKEAGLHAKELLAKDSFQELCQYRGDIATAVLMASIDRPDNSIDVNFMDYDPATLIW